MIVMSIGPVLNEKTNLQSIVQVYVYGLCVFAQRSGKGLSTLQSR